MTGGGNTLYFGDCLQVMREDIPNESVDLVYLDPPFNSKRLYNAFMGGAQWVAFNDTWRWAEAVNDWHEVAGKVDTAPVMESLAHDAGRRRHARLSRLYGQPPCRMSARSQADRFNLSSLRPYGVALSQGVDGRDIRRVEFLKRSHMEADKRAWRRAALRTRARYDILLHEDGSIHVEPRSPTAR